MKTLLLSLLCLASLPVLAHPGHPGPHAHGDATHLIVGLVAALPLLGTGALWLRGRARRAAASRARKDGQ